MSMSRPYRWTVGITSVLGLTLTSGLTWIAHRFVQELSRPHELLSEAEITWGLPTLSEPPVQARRTLYFQACDGTLLCGDFWAQPQPAPTIVLCHGYRISRAHLQSVAALEHACGYNVLAFDFRGHGDSDDVMTSGGTAEVYDLEAALVVARHQPETLPGKIIIHGYSMGASVALLTPPASDVVAIIADSPYARLDDILRRMICYRLEGGKSLRQIHALIPAVAWSIVAVSNILFRVRFGYYVNARPMLTFRRWQELSKTTLQHYPIPILLIHSSGDTLIPIAHARQIAAEAKAFDVTLETYFVDGVEHCGAYGGNPLEYNRVLRSFLARYLGDDFPVQHLHSDENSW